VRLELNSSGYCAAQSTIALNSPLTKSCRSDSVALLSLMANQRWRWDDRARFRMT
jgi:hypothetical protein